MHHVSDSDLRRKAAELALDEKYTDLTQDEIYYAIRFAYRNDQVVTNDLKTFETAEAAAEARVPVLYDANTGRWVEDSDVGTSRLSAEARERLDSNVRSDLWDSGGAFQKELIEAGTITVSALMDLALGGLGSRRTGTAHAVPGAGNVSHVNPTNSNQNCTNCAFVVDNQLSTGAKASALPRAEPLPFSALDNLYNTKMSSWTSKNNIEQTLLRSGEGARAVVYGADANGATGHVWNAVVQNGKVNYIDGQTGASGLLNFERFPNLRFGITRKGK